MDQYTINQIKNNPLVYNYLREDSSWYKELTRNGAVIREIEEHAKHFYKLTREDKLKKLSKNIELISTFMDVLK
ncbi:MAG: YlbE-like family protein [Mycoplasmatota bacterium]|nr:YlbE-like family protein [Mycoplasmatota bacterium]